MSNFGETPGSSVERAMVGNHVIELIRPMTDSICLPDDLINPQPPDTVPQLILAREQGPCGGVKVAELIMDRLIAFRDEREAASGERIDIFANHPPSKGADRAKMYAEAGVSFDTKIEDVPEGSVYLFSAHGADPAEVEKAEAKGLHVIDTTCPLVGRIYQQIKRDQPKKDEVIKPNEVGVVYLATSYDEKHPEVRGTRGVARKAGIRFIPVTSVEEAITLADGEEAGPDQLSLDGLKRVFITGLTTNNSDVTQEVAETFENRMRVNGAELGFVRPYNKDSVCNTVKFRQNAIRDMIKSGAAETIIVAGALGSNNTGELVGAALDQAHKIDPEDLVLKRIIFANSHHDLPPAIEGTVGIVSGASTQQLNVDKMVEWLNPTVKIHHGEREDKDFRPLGGPQSLARKIFDSNDFSWFEEARL